MANIFADDLFEIYGTRIQISGIKDFRLGQIEFIQRPLYFERGKSKWGGLKRNSTAHNIEFGRMEYYAAIIGEVKYKTAIEDASANNVYETVVKSVAIDISNAFSRGKGKRIRYRIMNQAWRVSQRTIEEIPALLCREDGKISEVYPKDELYPLLGEPIAPGIVMIPALYITSTDGNYVFFGNGIQVQDVAAEYERLKLAVKAVKDLKEQEKESRNIFKNMINGKLNAPKIEIPFLKQQKKKELEQENITIKSNE